MIDRSVERSRGRPDRLGFTEASDQSPDPRAHFGIVTLEFLADAIIRPARKGRLQAIGIIDGRAVSLIFSLLGTEGVSLISLRAASDKERTLL